MVYGKVKCELLEKHKHYFHKNGHVIPTLPATPKLKPGSYYVQYTMNGDMYIINRIICQRLDESLNIDDSKEGNYVFFNAKLEDIIPNFFPYKFQFKEQ
jgi:hypothetical protein